MSMIKVASASLNQTPLDWQGNAERIVEAISRAKEQQVGLLCLPELCVTGYGCEDAFLSPDIYPTAYESLDLIRPHTLGLAVAVGIPIIHDGSFYNTACLLVNGEISAFYAKHSLAGSGVYYEPRWFKPWPNGLRSQIDICGHTVPIGDYVFDFDGARLGFEICEDAWVGQRPGLEYAELGVDFILNGSASHFSFGKLEVRKDLCCEGSRNMCAAYLYANLLGNEAGRIIFDGGSFIASGGEIIAIGERFSFSDIVLTTAVVNLEEKEKPTESDADSSFKILEIPFSFPQAEPEDSLLATPSWESDDNLKGQEFARAVSLGLFDYLRKSHSKGFVVSLSGGADSSATAILCAYMVALGVAELGIEQFRARLAHIAALSEESDSPGIVENTIEKLLCCVYQATKNSSSRTLEASRMIAEALGAEFREFNIDSIVENYKSLVGLAFGEELTWEKHDIPLQNIQARTRGPLVWLIANLKGALLLATSNRSEAAVGYTTMDGDTCGGLSPIAGIDKAFLLKWLRWVEIGGLRELGPINELHLVTGQRPTAELRPLESKQSDEDDLMPYDILDSIERAAIGDKLMPVGVYQRMLSEYPKQSPEQLKQWVERFFVLWGRNQWKRERYAPSFHLDDQNLDPKTWCRFPILSGNFEHELRELRDV